ncbi:hypothetical protein AMST5_00765 [freshwater sediment metagenome]|uniref:Uncharacterized protein n=1 Tax=freshwater sediment metagenome TaxID=556182 RepID=A0AA48M0W7_9ZZZZ
MGRPLFRLDGSYLSPLKSIVMKTVSDSVSRIKNNIRHYQSRKFCAFLAFFTHPCSVCNGTSFPYRFAKRERRTSSFISGSLARMDWTRVTFVSVSLDRADRAGAVPIAANFLMTAGGVLTYGATTETAIIKSSAASIRSSWVESSSAILLADISTRLGAAVNARCVRFGNASKFSMYSMPRYSSENSSVSRPVNFPRSGSPKISESGVFTGAARLSFPIAVHFLRHCRQIL